MIDFAQYESRYGLPTGYLSRLMQIESGGNIYAKNPRSTAKGPFQFIDSTAEAYGLRDPFDLDESADAAARLARDNANILRNALGREPTAAELYLAHQQGGGGAKKLLTNMSAPATEIVGEKAVTLNAGDLDMSAGDFANMWLNKFDQTLNAEMTPDQQRAAGYARRANDTQRLALEAYKAGDMTKSEASRYVSEDLLDGIIPEDDEEASFFDRLGDAAKYMDFAGIGQAQRLNTPSRLSTTINRGTRGSGASALGRFGIASLV